MWYVGTPDAPSPAPPASGAAGSLSAGASALRGRVRPKPCVLSAHRGVLLVGRALGLDGSKLSWQAFDFAAGLIQRRNAGGRMCVMHVAATGEKAELVPESLK